MIYAALAKIELLPPAWLAPFHSLMERLLLPRNRLIAACCEVGRTDDLVATLA